jgi:hypothetical protein
MPVDYAGRLANAMRLTREVGLVMSAWPVARALQIEPRIPARTKPVLTVKTAEKNDRTPMVESRASKPDAPLIPKNRAIKILAKSLYRELRTQGYDEKQVVSLATELISEVTQTMERDKST